MARIVYGVSGEGSGHSSRAREMLTHLVSAGHQVKVVSYDRGYRNLKDDFDVFEFDDHSAYVGISYNPDERRKAHETGKRKGHEIDSLVHRKIKSGVPYEFIIFPDRLEPTEVARIEEEKIREYKQNGWKILNRAKGGSLGGKPVRWTESKIRKEAEKYAFRRDFKEQAPGAYDRAIDLGILQEVCAHMPKRAPNRPRKKK